MPFSPSGVLAPIGATDERRIARAKSVRARLGQNAVDTSGFARKPVFRLVRFAQQSENFLALVFRTKSEIGPSDRR